MSRIPNRITIARDTLTEGDLSRIVREISIAGTAVLAGNPPDSTYHFRFSLIFQNMTSVRLDIQPYLLDNPPVKERALLVVESKNYTKSFNVDTISFDYFFAVPTTAGDILDYLLNAKKRDQYDFDYMGEGCRTWCEAVLKDLIEMGIMPVGTLAKFKVWEMRETKKQGGRMPDPRPAGRFYN